MATTLNIARFIRSVRQGRTAAPVSCTAMDACTQQAYDALLADSWTRVEERESGLPRHNWAQTGFSPRWDAAKYCGDYAAGYQHGYATAVCYTIRMPADALAGTVAKIASLAIPVCGDRWLADGCNIDVALSDSAVPPAWDAPPDDAVTGQLAVVPSNTGSDTSAIVTFDWSAAPKTSLAYLHITLRLTDYLTHRGAWIEGGAMLDGANIAVEFDRAVTADPETQFDTPLMIMRQQTPPESEPSLDHVFATLYQPDNFGITWYMRHALNNSNVLMARSALDTGAYFLQDGVTNKISTTATLMLNNFFSVGDTFTGLLLSPAAAHPIDAGIDIRLVAYGIGSGAFSTAAGEWPTDVHDDSATPGAFWRGAATSIKVAYTDLSTATLGCALVLDRVIRGGGNLSDGAYIPITPWTPAGDACLVICVSVADFQVVDGPPAPLQPDTKLGMPLTSISSLIRLQR